MERKRVLTGIVSINGDNINTKWEEISFDSQQLSHFQNVLMKQQPGLNLISATLIILQHRIDLAENQGLIFLIEGVDVIGSEDENLKNERMFAQFLKEINRYTVIGSDCNWQYDKVKSILLGKHNLNDKQAVTIT